MTVEEALSILTTLSQVRGRKFNESERSSIGSVYATVLGKPFKVTSCNDCYRDAVIESLCYIRKYNKFREYINMEYRLSPGAVVRIYNDAHTYTNNDLTDEIAERYIMQDPSNIRWFAEYPSNYRERINARLNNVIAVKESEKTLQEEIADDIADGMNDYEIMEKYRGREFEGKKIGKRVLQRLIEEQKAQ